MTDISDAHTQQPSLRGKKAVISGGTTGIGRAIAVLLASSGVDVFICGRDPQHLQDALQRIGEVGKATAYRSTFPRPTMSAASSPPRSTISAASTLRSSMPRYPPQASLK